MTVAEAPLAHTDTLMQYANIRAAFDGKIAHCGIDTGDFVMSAACTNGESLFTLNRVDRLRIVFDLPESAAALIELGQSVELTLDSLKDQMFHAEVKRTAGQLDKRARKELRPLSFSNSRWVSCEPTSGLLPDEPTGADDHRVQ